MNTHETEQHLIDAAKSGDTAALEKLLRCHYDQIYAVCRRLAGNDADGEDATQEALMAVVRGLDRFEGQSKFSTWIYRVATNAALDELRRRQRRAAVIEASERFRPTGAVMADDSDVVVARLELDAALAALPEEFQVPVVLRDIAGCDYANIAEILGIPPGTVRSRIARGRARLAEQLSLHANKRDQNSGNPDDALQRQTHGKSNNL